MTTFYDGKRAIFKITDTGSTERDLSDYLVELVGLPGQYEMVDGIAFGDEGAPHWLKGCYNGEVTARFKWSDDALVGPDLVLEALLQHTAATAFEYGPRGSTSGAAKYTGNIWVEECSDVVRVNEDLEMTVKLRTQGIPTRSTYS